uniref:Uncharacterized protein n=1 Tax=Oryza glumipatula TaxID=40148 RepID=A0A0D9Z9G9_9ORYZ
MSAKLPQVIFNRSRGLQLHNQLGLTLVNRLLPSAHFHGQCSKLYIRTCCKASRAPPSVIVVVH